MSTSKLPADLVRRRAAQGIVLVALVAGAPFIAAALWPESAKYVPPSLLSILVLVSVAYALLVWRTDPPPVTSAKARYGHRIAAGVGLLLSAFLSILWVRSLL